RREIVEVALEFLSHPHPRQVLVPAPISEPTSHLKQRIVSRCRSQEETDGQSFERKTSREHVASDGNVDAARDPIVYPGVALAVLNLDFSSLYHVSDQAEQLVELDRRCRSKRPRNSR